MKHTKRRRWDMLWIALAAVGAGAVATIGALGADAERIGNYWLLSEIDANGEALVIEVIDYDFGPRSRHGIFREIPDLDPESRIVVTSPTAPDQFVVTARAGSVELKIGDPDLTVLNRHRYRIEYTLGALVRGDRVSWNAVGTDWVVPINNAEIHITAPYGLEDSVCDSGGFGDTGGCEVAQIAPGHLLVEVSGLDTGEGVTVSATHGSDLTGAPPPPPAPTGPAVDPGTGWFAPALAALVAAGLAAGMTSRWVRRLGKEQVWEGGAADAAFGPSRGTIAGVQMLDQDDLGEMATIEFESPRGLSAAAGGIIHSEQVRSEHQVAWLIERAICDEIVLDETGDDLTIDRGSTEPDPAVASALDAMFAGQTTIVLGTYDETFAEAWTDLGEELEEWRRASGPWDPAGRARKRRFRLSGSIATVLGLVMAGFGGAFANRAGSGWITLVVVGGVAAGIGMAAVIRSWELLIRSPEGSARWLQTESFRRFIAASEARHAEAAARMGILRHYTAWAVALGELDHWEKAVESAADIPGSAALGATSDLRFVALAPRFSSATTQTFTAPSSSGSGGVGGGGGGGGGGSW